MRIGKKTTVKVDELAHLIPTNAGASFGLLWRILYSIRLLKYIHIKQFQCISKSFNKICTYNKLQELCERGYLKSPKSCVYYATNKVLPILKECGYITETLPAEPKGLGDSNELHNTDIFIKLMKLPYFYTLLYPQFGQPKSYLRPDALLVQHDIDNRRYKLTFIEVEKYKPQWNQNWLENKRDNYLKLSGDIEFYKTWEAASKALGFPKADITTLKFSVCFVGTIKKDFGKEYSFIDDIRHF